MASYIVDLNMFKVFRMNFSHAQYNFYNLGHYKTRTLQTISVFGEIRRSNEENNKKRCKIIHPVTVKYSIQYKPRNMVSRKMSGDKVL